MTKKEFRIVEVMLMHIMPANIPLLYSMNKTQKQDCKNLLAGIKQLKKEKLI